MEDYYQKYFTIEGKEALFNRMKNLTKLYEENISYPFKAQMVGFMPLNIPSRDAHKHMINELRQILCLEKITLNINDCGRHQIIEVK